MPHSNARTGLLAACVVAMSNPAVAAEGGEQTASLSPVVVTATRSPEPVDESTSSVTVIDRQDIERAQTSSLPELLGRVQGLELAQTGGRGTASSLFIRGTDNDQIVVLIDGIRVGSATLGTTALESLPLANIERIEVVRGPRSSLYGADAIGGVVQIFTRENTSAHAGVAAGSNQYSRVTAGYGQQGETGGFSIEFSAEETEGIDARENDFVRGGELCGSSFNNDCDEPDKDGFESANLSLRGNKQISTDIRLSGSVLIADSESEFDGSSQNSSEQRQTAASGSLRWQVAPAWRTEITLGRSTDDSENFLDGESTSRFDTTQSTAQWQNDIVLGQAHAITAGIDFLREAIDTSKVAVFDPSTGSFDEQDFAVTERDTAGVFLQHQWSGGPWNTQISVRRDVFGDGFDDPDDNDEIDAETTGSIGAGYRIQDDLRVFGSYGTGFRAPTFNELFFPGFGNSELAPEESTSVEAGLRGNTGPTRWEVTAYRTEIEDLIETVQTSSGSFAPRNVDKARIQGIELSVNAAWNRWQAELNADFKDPENTETGDPLERRAKHNLRAGLSRQIGAWTLGGDATIAGERFEDGAEDDRLDAYALLDLHARWRITPEWRFAVAVNNVADTQYTLADTYNRDGRNYLLELDWRPARK